jgi:hypothetical protein
MSLVAISGNASGTGTLTIAAPNTNSNYTLTLPTNTGTLISTKSAGTVLQVVSTTKTDTFSTASTSFVDITGLSVSITPTSATSKILVHVSVVAGSQGIFAVRLLRDSTAVGVADTVSAHTPASVASFTNSDANTTAIGAFTYLDSPTTTSATTYKVQATTQGSTNYINRTINDVDSNTGPRSASSITVMEIAA